MQPVTPLPPPSAISEAPAPPNTPFISNHAPPPVALVKNAIPALDARINPKRKSGVGHQKAKLNPLAMKDLTSVLELFRTYTTKDIVTGILPRSVDSG
jgi:hypothetical protein